MKEIGSAECLQVLRSKVVEGRDELQQVKLHVERKFWERWFERWGAVSLVMSDPALSLGCVPKNSLAHSSPRPVPASRHYPAEEEQGRCV